VLDHCVDFLSLIGVKILPELLPSETTGENGEHKNCSQLALQPSPPDQTRVSGWAALRGSWRTLRGRLRTRLLEQHNELTI